MTSFPDPPGGLLLTADLLHRWDIELADDDGAYTARYPGPPGPGPVHTVYVPVPRCDETVIDRWRIAAMAAVEDLPVEWAGVLDGIAAATGGQDPQVLHELTLAKLADEPIEDLRIDLEDGYRAHRGPIDDADEDAAAIAAAGVVAS